MLNASTQIYEPEVGLEVVAEFARGKVPPELMTGEEGMSRRSGYSSEQESRKSS